MPTAITPTDGYQDIGSGQVGNPTNIALNGVPYWGSKPEAYDTVTLAGFALPGLCSVKGKGYEMRKKHQKPAGKHGASTIVIANEPAEFVIHLMMNTEEHLRAFEGIIPFFKPKPKPKPNASGSSKSNAFTVAFTGQATSRTQTIGNTTTTDVRLGDDSQPGYLSVHHPLLELFGISHCRVLLVTLPEQVEDKGMWKSEIHCMEEVLEGKRKAKTGPTGASPIVRDTGYLDANGKLKKDSPAATSAGPPVSTGGATGSY